MGSILTGKNLDIEVTQGLKKNMAYKRRGNGRGGMKIGNRLMI